MLILRRKPGGKRVTRSNIRLVVVFFCYLLLIAYHVPDTMPSLLNRAVI